MDAEFAWEARKSSVAADSEASEESFEPSDDGEDEQPQTNVVGSVTAASIAPRREPDALTAEYESIAQLERPVSR